MKLLTIILLFIGSAGFAQTSSKPVKVDSSIATVTDSTALFSIKDLQPLYDKLGDLPHKTAEPFINFLKQLVADKVQRYNNKPKNAKQ